MRIIIIISILILIGLTINKSHAQELTLPTNYGSVASLDSSDWESEWSFGGSGHKFTMNYTLFGKSFANGVWYGSLGYVTGMWLSGNKTGWGMVGSIVAVNIPILLDNNYDTPELWVGSNLGALTISAGATFTIEMHRNGKASWRIMPLIRKR